MTESGNEELASASPINAGSSIDPPSVVESIDDNPSGPAFRPTPDLTRDVLLVVQKLTQAIYCSLSPSVVLATAIALLINATLWRVLAVVFWQDLPASGLGAVSLDQVVFPVEVARGNSFVLLESSLVGQVYFQLIESWKQLSTSRGSDFFFHLIGAFGSLAVWALAGTFVCRVIGLRMTGGSAKLKSTWKFASASFVDALGSIAIPLVAVGLCALPLMIAGLFLAVDVLSPLGAVLSLVFGVLSIPMAVVLVGLLLCWPLMFPAIAMEGRDCFESISRGYAYVLQRPFHYFSLVMLASLAGIVLAWLVDGLGDAAVGFLNWGLSWGANVNDGNRLNEVLNPIIEGETPTAALVTYFTSPVTRFWGAVLLLLVRSAKYAIFWGLAVGIYVLMRHYLDRAPLDSIYLEGDRKLSELQAEANQPTGTQASGTQASGTQASGTQDTGAQDTAAQPTGTQLGDDVES